MAWRDAALWYGVLEFCFCLREPAYHSACAAVSVFAFSRAVSTSGSDFETLVLVSVFEVVFVDFGCEMLVFVPVVSQSSCLVEAARC